METVYSVKGMTCGHCVSAVSTEIGKLDGVDGGAPVVQVGAGLPLRGPGSSTGNAPMSALPEESDRASIIHGGGLEEPR